MGIVITKLENNQVEVTGGLAPYTLLGSYEVYEAADIDGVRIIREGKMKDQFTQSNVTQVVRKDGTVVAISDMSTLYSELKDFFFFELEPSGGGGSFTLTDGNGTTANGSAVDLGGSMSSNADIVTGSNDLTIDTSNGGDFVVNTVSGGKCTFNIDQSDGMVINNSFGTGLTFNSNSWTEVKSGTGITNTWDNGGGLTGLDFRTNTVKQHVLENPTQNSVLIQTSSKFQFITTELSGGDQTGLNINPSDPNPANAVSFLYEDEILSEGAGYAADYSANGIIKHGDRWKPDVGYVNTLIANSVASGMPFSNNGTASVDGVGYSVFNANGQYYLYSLDTDISTYTNQGVLCVTNTGVEFFHGVGDGSGGNVRFSRVRVQDNLVEFKNGGGFGAKYLAPADYSNLDWANDDDSIPSIGMVKDNSSLVINATPPANTSVLWFNTNDSLIYFYDGTNWLSSQLYETTFIDQGSTTNNTWFRVGNTITGETGIGFHLEFSAQIEGLSFNRQPSSASIGNFWLYSNSGLPNPDQAVVAVTFTSTADSRGYINSPTYTALDEGSYIAVRWNGTQTNNNIVSLKYRKKYI